MTRQEASKAKSEAAEEEQLLASLNNEFQALRQARLERVQQYKSQFQDLTRVVRKERKERIRERQAMFDKEELDSQPPKMDKKAICDTLIMHLERLTRVGDHVGRDVGSLDIQEHDSGENEEDDSNEEKVLRIEMEDVQEEEEGECSRLLFIPLEIMDLFAEINVDPPVFMNQVQSTIALLGEIKQQQ